MKLMFDVLVREFVETMILGFCEEDEEIINITDEAGEAAVFIGVLESMVLSGLATHAYVANGKIDEFRSTEKLVE